MRAIVIPVAGVAVAILLAACGDGGGATPTPSASVAGPSASPSINPADFTARVDNPLFPLTSRTTMVYEGEEVDPDTGETLTTRVEATVLPRTDTVGGVAVTVVKADDFTNGELLESTLDYYAQHVKGAVYYLGERVDEYDGGEVVGHTGQWLAGEGDNQAGIFMPAGPRVGDEFEQEKAPGVAEDRTKIVAVAQTVTVPAGTFEGCVKTEDYNPLDDATEFKYYWPSGPDQLLTFGADWEPQINTDGH